MVKREGGKDGKVENGKRVILLVILRIIFTSCTPRHTTAGVQEHFANEQLPATNTESL